MKKKLVSILLFTVIALCGLAQGKDSSKPQQVEVKISLDNKKDTTKESVGNAKKEECKTCHTDKVKGIQWVLVFLPTIFFLVLFYYFMTWLKRDGFKLADALSSCEPLTLSQQTKDDDGKLTNTTSSQVLPRSASRIIAFLTGITAMVIGLCLITYYIFITLADCPSLNLDDLWKVIASLGIGIIPYGANMWKESKTDSQANQPK